MNIAALAETAYSDASAPIRTERSTEYQVFSKITHRLSVANSGGFSEFVELAAAVNDNRRLWAVLAADVADDNNELPAQLRARIFFLAEFTEHHSHKVLNREATPDALVEINTSVMRGLRTDGGMTI